MFGVISTEGPVVSGRSGEIWLRTEGNQCSQPDASTEFILIEAERAQRDKKT